MKTLFVAINAKYIHTNLAVRYMHELAKQNGYTSTEIAEYTINQRLPQLLRELYLTKANHMIFSLCFPSSARHRFFSFTGPKSLIQQITRLQDSRRAAARS